MKEYKVYNAIQQLKERGFRKDSVAKQLNINWRTVDRYWDMTADEYESQTQGLKRGSRLDDYQNQVLIWLRQYPSMTASQVCDWLKENYKADFKEQTVVSVKTGGV
jgi:transposase